MKRWAAVVSFVLFLALCASAVAWALQLFRPATRPVVAAPLPETAAVADLRPAAGLFGARQASATAASYVLKGVVVARKARDSAAIIAADGKPAQAVAVGAEVVPGVTVKEVHTQYVLLSDNGHDRRVELPATSLPQASSPQIPAAQPLPAQASAPQTASPSPEVRDDAEDRGGSTRRRNQRTLP